MKLTFLQRRQSLRLSTQTAKRNQTRVTFETPLGIIETTTDDGDSWTCEPDNFHLGKAIL